MEDSPGAAVVERKEAWRTRRRDGSAALAKLFERPLPYSLEAEMALLGAMLLDPSVTPDVISIVGRAQDFYSESHAAIFQTLVEVYDRIPDADLVPIIDALRDKGKLDLIGGGEYLMKLAHETPSGAGALHYARSVAEKAKLRRLVEAADEIIYDALHVGSLGPDGAREVLDKAETAIFEIAQEDQRSDPQRLEDLLQLEMDRIENDEGKGISGLPTGFDDLDDLLRGLQPGEMVIIAARPSMGKTALALNLAEQVARGGRTPWTSHATDPDVGVGVFSLEMTKAAVTQRFLSAMSGVDSHRLRGGERLSEAERVKIDVACEKLRQARVFVDDTAGLTVMGLRARARRMVAQHAVRVIMVDYLQLLTAPGSARESRQVEVSAISRGLKALARELNVPVICLSQLNRASEQREGNRPRMSDLRESGSIEQDADVVILLHREEYYHIGNPDWAAAAENSEKVGVAELIIAKQRNGPTGLVKLTWDADTTRFKNHSRHEPMGDDAGYAGADDPRPTSRPAFVPGPRTGPAPDHRDGGGPDRDFDDEGEPAPF